MSLFKRLSTTLYSRIDQMVGEIENHDALIQAVIREQRKKLAAARMQLNRIKASEQKVARQIVELKENEARWSERAVRTAGEDERQALACLQRRRVVRQQLVKLEEAQTAYQQTASRMSADIARCEQELNESSRKHELMRARQTGIDAMNVFDEYSTSSIDTLETSFNRWELKLAQGEVNFDSNDFTDALEQEFLSQESEQQLRAELAELMEKENNHDNA